jgi:hypothetical protein
VRSVTNGGFDGDGLDARAVEKLFDLVTTAWRAQAILAAVKLGLPRALADGRATAARLAEDLDCDPDALARLLRALASLGICREVGRGAFTLGELGHLLRTDRAGLHHCARWFGEARWPGWLRLSDIVKNGHAALDKPPSAGYVGLERDDAMARLFHDAMGELTRVVARDPALVDKVGRTGCVIDVGGGHGELIVPLLHARPRLRGVVFDLPHAMRGARARLRTSGLSRRCSTQSGDFFDSIPRGGDVYLLKSVLHNWSDERCVTLLRNCRAAMTPAARLLVIERVRPARVIASRAHQAFARTDLVMLIAHTGRERSASEMRKLLAAAGLTVAGRHGLALGYSLMEAVVSRRGRGS